MRRRSRRAQMRCKWAREESSLPASVHMRIGSIQLATLCVAESIGARRLPSWVSIYKCRWFCENKDFRMFTLPLSAAMCVKNFPSEFRIENKSSILRISVSVEHTKFVSAFPYHPEKIDPFSFYKKVDERITILIAFF
jgi:hypothetical protein